MRLDVVHRVEYKKQTVAGAADEQLISHFASPGRCILSVSCCVVLLSYKIPTGQEGQALPWLNAGVAWDCVRMEVWTPRAARHDGRAAGFRVRLQVNIGGCGSRKYR